MLSRLQALRRRLYVSLTTSERDRRNRKDYIMSDQRALRHERDRVHRTNDVFHRAGHRDLLRSAEALTLQFRTMAWSFLLVPSLFVVGVVFAIYFSGRDERSAALLAKQSSFARRLDDAAAARATLSTLQRDASALAQEGVTQRTRDDAVLDADITRLTSQIDELTALQVRSDARATPHTQPEHVVR